MGLKTILFLMAPQAHNYYIQYFNFFFSDLLQKTADRAEEQDLSQTTIQCMTTGEVSRNSHTHRDRLILRQSQHHKVDIGSLVGIHYFIFRLLLVGWVDQISRQTCTDATQMPQAGFWQHGQYYSLLKIGQIWQLLLVSFG